MKKKNSTNPGEPTNGSQGQSNDSADKTNKIIMEKIIPREMSYGFVCINAKSIYPVKLSSCDIRICNIGTSDVDKTIDDIKLPDGYEGIPHEGTFTLTYPFENGRTQKFTFSTFKDIAVTVKESYEVMFCTSINHGQLDNTLMSHYTGIYGTSYHCLEDLYIESVYYNPDNKMLFIGIGS